MSEAMKWQGMDTAPKDRVILLNVGYPYTVIGIWSEFEEDFVYADVQVNINDGKWNDPYFETQSATAEEVRGWMPLPEVANAK